MNTSNRDDSFVARLIRWQNDRGALANLRAGLRSRLRIRAWPLLSQLGPLARPDGREDPMLIVRETVAGLWASDPDSHCPGSGNFGAVCRKLRGDHESFDLRFRRLLACDTREELCARTIPMAAAAQAKGIAVDCDELYEDMRFFSAGGRDAVRIRWAQAYWGIPAEQPASESRPAASNPI